MNEQYQHFRIKLQSEIIRSFETIKIKSKSNKTIFFEAILSKQPLTRPRHQANLPLFLKDVQIIRDISKIKVSRSHLAILDAWSMKKRRNRSTLPAWWWHIDVNGGQGHFHLKRTVSTVRKRREREREKERRNNPVWDARPLIQFVTSRSFNPLPHTASGVTKFFN